MADLELAEIPYESGAVHFRHALIRSPDGSKWVRHGLFVEYSECGSVVSEGHYLNRLEHGHWRDFYPSVQMAASGQYEHGAEVGPWHYWNERGEEEQGDVQPRRNAGA